MDEKENRTIVKAVNLTGEAKEVTLCLEGTARTMAEITELSGHELTGENSLDNPNQIVPKEKTEPVEENELLYTFPPHSVTVISFR